MPKKELKNKRARLFQATPESRNNVGMKDLAIITHASMILLLPTTWLAPRLLAVRDRQSRSKPRPENAGRLFLSKWARSRWTSRLFSCRRNSRLFVGVDDVSNRHAAASHVEGRKHVGPGSVGPIILVNPSFRYDSGYFFGNTQPAVVPSFRPPEP